MNAIEQNGRSSDRAEARTTYVEDELDNLPAVTHGGKPVLTTDLLAKAYDVEPKTIHDGHSRNVEQFIEGIHFFKLMGAELRRFKDQPVFSGLVDKRASHLLLWTERGAARHAKMLSSPEAWAVFDKLEASYFEKGKGSVPQIPTPFALSEFRAYKSLGKLIGLDHNQSIISANQAIRKTLGVDLLDNLGQTHLIAPQQERLMTPTDIGIELGGVSGMAVNALLSDRGFQVGRRDLHNRTCWEPTEAGQGYAVFQDTGKKQGSGTPVRQLKWAASIVERLR